MHPSTRIPDKMNINETNPNPKLYVTAEDQLLISFQLARQIYDSGFQPDYIVGIWRGGTPIGIVVHEFLQYHGIESDHIAIKTCSYHGSIQGHIEIYGCEYLINHVGRDDTVLLVDDVFDTGRTCQAIIDYLQQTLEKKMPQTVRIAVPYYKPNHNQTTLQPDYYIEETDKWIVFPHSCEGLTQQEIIAHKGEKIASCFNWGNETPSDPREYDPNKYLKTRIIERLDIDK